MDQSIATSLKDRLAALALPAPDAIGLGDALAIYEAFRPMMPSPRPTSPQQRARLVDILPEVDALVLDGYGVINVGTGPIDGIHDFFAAAAARDCPIIVLTNGASFDTSKTAAKYAGWDLPITRAQTVSSRDAMISAFATTAPAHPGSFTHISQPLALPDESWMGDDPDFFEQVENFLFLGAVDWTEAQQERLAQAFRTGSKTLHIANPDVVSPHADFLNPEPGYWTARLMQEVDVMPRWYGKPHAPAFELALKQLQTVYGRSIAPERVAMVGDSLHTDVLGASAVGMQSVLITDYGLFRDGGAARAMDQCGIHPTWVVSRL